MMFADEGYDLERDAVGRVGNCVDVRLAASIDDFLEATALMRVLAHTTRAPIGPADIGRMLARLGERGGCRETGALLLASEADEIIGFAFLGRTIEGRITLTWMHAPPGRDEVSDALWVAALGMLDEWAMDEVDMSAFVTEAIAARKARPLN